MPRSSFARQPAHGESAEQCRDSGSGIVMILVVYCELLMAGADHLRRRFASR